MERRTWSPKLGDLNSGKRWYIVDAEGQTSGRIASVIAATLRGKTKPTYTPHADMGDFVIVVNAEKVVLTGKKETQKLYSHHSAIRGLATAVMREVRARILSALSKTRSEACCREMYSAGGSSEAQGLRRSGSSALDATARSTAGHAIVIQLTNQ